MKEEKRLGGLITETDYGGWRYDYDIKLSTEQFIKSLEDRKAGPKESIVQWRELESCFEGKFPNERYVIEQFFYKKPEGVDIDFDRCILYQPGDGGYFTLKSNSKLTEEELEIVKDTVGKTTEKSLFSTALASKIDSELKGDTRFMGYEFRPGYKWEDNTLKIYEDLEEEGEIMRQVNERMKK